MERYKNLSGQSNVIAYSFGPDSITVQFASGAYRNYVYNSIRPGAGIVAQMKDLAVKGIGLNSFIGRVVKANYVSRY